MCKVIKSDNRVFSLGTVVRMCYNMSNYECNMVGYLCNWVILWSLWISGLCFLRAEGIVRSSKVVTHYSAVVSTELSCNLSDHLHKPASAAAAAVATLDILAPEFSKYENFGCCQYNIVHTNILNTSIRQDLHSDRWKSFIIILQVIMHYYI